MRQLRRGLRAARYFWHRLRSCLVLLWYKSLYANLEIGNGVTVDRGVKLVVSSDGFLRIGDGTHIEGNCQLHAKGGRLSIGPRSFIGAGTIVVACSQITIGEDALISAYVTIRDQDHGFAQNSISYSLQPLTIAPVIIGTNVWLGTHVTVLKGVTIGSGCVVAANSVVTRELPPCVLSAGVPAVLVRSLRD